MKNTRQSISISKAAHRRLMLIRASIKPQPKIGALAEHVIMTYPISKPQTEAGK